MNGFDHGEDYGVEIIGGIVLVGEESDRKITVWMTDTDEVP